MGSLGSLRGIHGSFGGTDGTWGPMEPWDRWDLGLGDPRFFLRLILSISYFIDTWPGPARPGPAQPGPNGSEWVPYGGPRAKIARSPPIDSMGVRGGDTLLAL